MGGDKLRTPDSCHMARIVGTPIIKFSNLIAKSDSIPSKISGILNHESMGPQYPLTASRKLPTAYFSAMVIYDGPSGFKL
jgi:hypothetical protein